MEENGNPLALASLDDHPAIAAAYATVLRCEQALATAKEALGVAEAAAKHVETRRVVALLSGDPGPAEEDSHAVSHAEREVRIAARALSVAQQQHAETKERVRQELMARCRAFYIQRLTDAVAAAEDACQSHTTLARLYSRMNSVLGPLDWNDLHYADLMADDPVHHWQGWYANVQRSGLLPPKE